MAGPPTAQYADLRFQYGGAGLRYPAQWSLGLRAPFPASVDGIFDAAQSWWGESMKSRTANAFRLEQLELKIGPEQTGATVTRAIGENGTSGPGAEPPQVALLVRKEIEGITGRRWGRMYVPCLVDGIVPDGGVLAPATLTSFQSSFDLLFEFLVESEGVTPVVFNGTSDPSNISRLAVQARTATQRRRNRR